MKYLYSFMIFLILPSLNAQAEEAFPDGCQPISFMDKQAVLKADKSVMVMLHNISSTELWVTHPVTQAGASAGWNTKLKPGNWAALALNDPTFALSCIESKPGHEQQISCTDVLAACQLTGVKQPSQGIKGTFWAGEDMSLNALMAYIGRKGFTLPATTKE